MVTDALRRLNATDPGKRVLAGVGDAEHAVRTAAHPARVPAAEPGLKARRGDSGLGAEDHPGMTYAIRLEDLLDSVRVDPDQMVQSAQEPSTNGLPDGVEDDVRLAAIAGV